MKGTFVFLGPSLPMSKAQAVLPDATYLPPIRRGDLMAALHERPAVVGIIDGQFLQTLAVSPLEIFAALRAGTIVLGAASMGALRAVEMAPFGMIGVGTIFRWFRDERLVAEDEVAVAYEPNTGSALSDALVNMRFALSRAAAENVIGRDTRRRLIHVARSLYFPERTYYSTMRLAKNLVPRVELDRLRVWLRDHAPDLKAQDAIRLLRVASRMSKSERKRYTDEPDCRADHWQADHRLHVSTSVQSRPAESAGPLHADVGRAQRADAVRYPGDRSRCT